MAEIATGTRADSFRWKRNSTELRIVTELRETRTRLLTSVKFVIQFLFLFAAEICKIRHFVSHDWQHFKPAGMLQQDRQGTYKRNNDVRSCNRYWNWKARNITYSECGFVSLRIQHAMRMRNIVICGLPDSTILCTYYFINATFLLKNFIENKMCVLILYTNFVWKISHS
jgi:hypothetical protein